MPFQKLPVVGGGGSGTGTGAAGQGTKRRQVEGGGAVAGEGGAAGSNHELVYKALLNALQRIRTL